ncbi:MAG: alpha/beta hydrolase [Clostridiales bacterium]|nr:alpha/beta hydrolase [Clostridiales bacterium]
MKMHENTKPFYFKGGDTACLLIHGFTGTPAHMLPLGKFLHEKGFTTKAVLLKGHGTTVEDMQKTNYADWFTSVENAYQELKEKYKIVYVIGFSMGGILTLQLALKYDIPKIVAIATPMRVVDKLAKWTWIGKYFMKYKPWGEPEDPAQDEKKYVIRYDKVPLNCVAEMMRAMKKVEKELTKVESETLVIQPRKDKSVMPISAEIIYDNISAKRKKLIWLENSYHGCTLGKEKDIIHEEIFLFFKNESY